MVIDSDYVGSCKSNNHTITTTTTPCKNRGGGEGGNLDLIEHNMNMNNQVSNTASGEPLVYIQDHED